MKTRNLNKNYLILTIKNQGHLLPILVKNDPESPEVFNLALVYTKFRITHNQPYRGLKIRVSYIRFLMDFYTEYKPQTQAKNRTFLEDFFKAFNQGQVLGFDQITETRRSRAVQPIRDFILWVVKHKEVAQENERVDYLKENFNMVPRTKTDDLAQLVGWKKPRFQYPERYESEIVFVGAVEQGLQGLHIEYMNWRKQFKYNPYYFLTENGTPLSANMVMKKFERDCEKIGIKRDS
jgi:hypothetical protein